MPVLHHKEAIMVEPQEQPSNCLARMMMIMIIAKHAVRKKARKTTKTRKKPTRILFHKKLKERQGSKSERENERARIIRSNAINVVPWSICRHPIRGGRGQEKVVDLLMMQQPLSTITTTR